jgi:hypothetical protein
MSVGKGFNCLLENSTIGYLTFGLALELGCRISQHEPVLLEDTKVGGVASFSVTCKSVSHKLFNIARED